MGQAGRERVERLFRWPQAAERTLHHYQAML
jgi:hypothetical protein